MFDSPNQMSPESGGQAPQSGMGQYSGQPSEAEANDNQRKAQFQSEVQKLQMQAQVLARMEPAFAPIARQIIEMTMRGLGQMMGSMPDEEASESPYM